MEWPICLNLKLTLTNKCYKGRGRTFFLNYSLFLRKIHSFFKLMPCKILIFLEFTKKISFPLWIMVTNPSWNMYITFFLYNYLENTRISGETSATGVYQNQFPLKLYLSIANSYVHVRIKMNIQWNETFALYSGA